MSAAPRGDYGRKYRGLRRKIKLLVYEQECFQMELRKAQRKFIKVSRDKSFLLDRLLQYEDINDDSSDSDATASSDNSEPEAGKILATPPQKKKISPPVVTASQSPSSHALQSGIGYSRSSTPTPSPYLETIESMSIVPPPSLPVLLQCESSFSVDGQYRQMGSSGFPSEYLSSFSDAHRTQIVNPRGERGKRERKAKAPKVKRMKVCGPLSCDGGDPVSIAFPTPGESLCPLPSKLPSSILTSVPQQMFSQVSEDENIDRDDDLVIDIPE